MNGAFRIAKLDFFTMKSQAVLYVIMVLIVSMFSIMDSSIIPVCGNSGQNTRPGPGRSPDCRIGIPVYPWSAGIPRLFAEDLFPG